MRNRIVIFAFSLDQCMTLCYFEYMATNRKTRTISLTEEQDRYLDRLVDGGQYQNASEVVRDALRTHAVNLEQQQVILDEIRSGIRRGFDDIEQGRFIEGTVDEVIGAVFDKVINQRPA